jgi:hypothetical protein
MLKLVVALNKSFRPLLLISEVTLIASLPSSVGSLWLDIWLLLVEESTLFKAVSNIRISERWHLVLTPHDFGIKVVLFAPQVVALGGLRLDLTFLGSKVRLIFSKVSIAVSTLIMEAFLPHFEFVVRLHFS